MKASIEYDILAYKYDLKSYGWINLLAPKESLEEWKRFKSKKIQNQMVNGQN